MKKFKVSMLYDRIDDMINKYGSGSICLGNLTDVQFSELLKHYPNYTITKDYFGYWNFVKINK